MQKKRLAILGSTGSIGTQTLQVVRDNPELFEVVFLTTNSNVELILSQAKEFKPMGVVITNNELFEQAKNLFPKETKLYAGQEALIQIAEQDCYDTLVSSLVGFAGLQPTIAAIKNSKEIALANKETMVVAGELINHYAKKYNSKILPIDSEHSAIFQCLVGENFNEIEKIILTASGGPFRTLPMDKFPEITLQQALKHPNWSMGSKITIDSATMMNKGLEVIEAKWLFDLPIEKIDVLIHPQSIVHSLVQYTDGSVKAQLGLPDMKLPIQYALSYPNRLNNNYNRLDLSITNSLTFEKPDFMRFPCLSSAFLALEKKGLASVVLNAANEVAVENFLANKIHFTDIHKIIFSALDSLNTTTDEITLEKIMDINSEARNFAKEKVKEINS